MQMQLNIVLPPGTTSRPTTPLAAGTCDHVHRRYHRAGAGPSSEAGPRWAAEIVVEVSMEEGQQTPGGLAAS
jgi:hypothetical protein